MTSDVAESSGPLLAPANYVTISLAAALTGLSEKAIRRKIEEGIWLEKREYIRVFNKGSTRPEVFISMRGYDRWLEAAAVSKPASGRSGSRSPTKASPTATP